MSFVNGTGLITSAGFNEADKGRAKKTGHAVRECAPFSKTLKCQVISFPLASLPPVLHLSLSQPPVLPLSLLPVLLPS